MAAQAKSGDLSADEFIEGLAEMAKLGEEARANRPAPTPPSLAELQAAARGLNETLVRNINAANARLSRPPPPARPLEEIRAEATAAAATLASRYDQLLRALHTLAEAQPTPGERFLVRHELAQVERSKARNLTQARTAIAGDQANAIASARNRARRIAATLDTAIEATAESLRSIQPGR